MPYTAWTKCRQRDGQLHGIGDSLLRSQSRAVSPRCMGGTKKSSCDFSVLCGPGELYHVPITCTNAARPSEELFPDLHDFSRSDFGLGVRGSIVRCSVVARVPPTRRQLSSPACRGARRSARAVDFPINLYCSHTRRVRHKMYALLRTRILPTRVGLSKNGNFVVRMYACVTPP